MANVHVKGYVFTPAARVGLSRDRVLTYARNACDNPGRRQTLTLSMLAFMGVGQTEK